MYLKDIIRGGEIMKGLLYKDWLMLKKYCRVYLLIIIVFLAVSVSADDRCAVIHF